MNIYEFANSVSDNLYKAFINKDDIKKLEFKKLFKRICLNNTQHITFLSDIQLYRVRKNEIKYLEQPYKSKRIGMNKGSNNVNRYGNLFYLGDSIDCCLAECDCQEKLRYTIGQFITIKDIKIVNLSEQGIFNSALLDRVKMYVMLYTVQKILAQDNGEDKKEVAYEICSWLFDIVRDTGARGIKYRSSKWQYGNWYCYAFIDDRYIEWNSSTLIDLVSSDEKNHSYRYKKIKKVYNKTLREFL